MSYYMQLLNTLLFISVAIRISTKYEQKEAGVTYHRYHKYYNTPCSFCYDLVMEFHLSIPLERDASFTSTSLAEDLEPVNPAVLVKRDSADIA